MARAVWSGSLTFGLVTLPVQLATATGSHTVRFRQLERGTVDRVRNKRVNERTGEEVPYDRIVKGYETGEGEYVIVEPEELDEITPGRSKAIEVTGFAELAAIEPVFFDTTYYLQPSGEAHTRTYGLLRDALAETGRAGIATMTMRQKEYLVAVHAESGVLVLHTLHWADEVRDPRQTLDNLPSAGRPAKRELAMATQLIEVMAMDWDPEEYRDRTHERVRRLVEAKRTGGSVAKADPAPESTNVVDLMSALRRSVDAAGGAKGGRGGRRSGQGGQRGRRSTAGGGLKELEGLTKEELYRRAAEAGLPGRSKMNREELVRELSRAAEAA